MKQEVVRIEFDVTLRGNGGINYDGGNQKGILTKHCGYDFRHNGRETDNTQLLKKNFRKLDEPVKNGYKTIDYEFVPKISEKCIGRHVFGETPEAMVWLLPEVAVRLISSPEKQLQGYMSAQKQFGKKHALHIGQAEADASTVVTVEQYTRDGARDENSLYYKEQVGTTEYKFKATFYIEHAQFMSIDKYFNRVSVDQSYIEGKNLLEQAFLERYGRVPYAKGIWTNNSNLYGTKYGESGLKMDDEYINSLIRFAAKKLLGIDITTNSGHAWTEEVIMTPIYVGLECGHSIKITKDNIDSMSFNIHQFYVEASQADWDNRDKVVKECEGKKREEKAKSSKGKNVNPENTKEE